MGALEEIRAAYRQQHLCLFIGAGVSATCGLPDWGRLAESVVERMWAYTTLHPVERPLGRWAMTGKNPLDSMRLARRKLGSDFNATVAECLYSSTLSQSGTVEAIVSLRDVRRICSFNYDDMLEEAFENRNRNYHTIVDGDTIPFLSQETLIFHPHGYLPRGGRARGDRSSYIVLSEDDYHQLYASPYSWANIIELTLLLHYTVLFVGCSLTDPNSRRLLDIVSRMRPGHGHYALLRDPADQPGQQGWELAGYYMIRKLEAEELADRGVTPLWFHDYSDIPRLLIDIQSDA